MRKLLVFATCMTALCIHGTTTEEARQIVREDVELHVNRPPGYNERTRQMYPVLMALEWEVRESFYSEMLAEKFDNPSYVNFIMRRLVDAAPYFPAHVNPETVDLVRRLARAQLARGGVVLREPDDYLSYKGDARDLDVFLMLENENRLATRVAGTNICYRWAKSWSSNSFIPSVTNAGPQAHYVQNILRQFWETIEPSGDYGYRDASKIPAELLTMVVWFDEDGNPVTNVDLAKYGLTMPELDVPNRPKGTKPKDPQPVIQEQPPEPVETPDIVAEAEIQRLEAVATMDTPPGRPWLYAGILSALCAGVVLWFIRKK